MKKPKVFQDYFNFTRSDRVGILLLLSCITVALLVPLLFHSRPRDLQQKTDSTWIASLRQLEIRDSIHVAASRQDESSGFYHYDPASTKSGRNSITLFYFDPNNLPAEGWKKLGIREKTIRTILNYISKGGRFRKPGDLKKIYGLRETEYERIALYIKISSTDVTPTDQKDPPFPPYPEKGYQRPALVAIDINTADSSAWIALPGIGTKLSARIINFREKLGGFYSISQVAETYGLPDSTFQKIKKYLKLEHISLRKINLNTATVEELKAHPYIRYSIAQTIVAYRTEHGTFTKQEDLKKLMAITEDLYQKISPYISVQ